MKNLLTTAVSRAQSVWRKVRLFALCGSLALCLVGQVEAQSYNELRALPVVQEVEAVAFYGNFLMEEGEGEEKEPTVEERLEKLEENYSDLGDDYGKLAKEYKGLKKKMKTLAATGHGEATMKVNGRVHVDMWSFPDSDAAINTFEIW